MEGAIARNDSGVNGNGSGVNGKDEIIRWAIVGSIVGFFAVGGIFGLSVYLFGASVAGAVAVGLFTGLLGGPGFGGMMGFVVQYSKYNDEPIG